MSDCFEFGSVAVPDLCSEDVLNKVSALTDLVAKRRRETHPAYHHLHSFDEGIWDCEYVVPWTKSAPNVDAQLMVMGQDWASEKFLREPKYNTSERISARKTAGQDEYLPTNRRLKSLLRAHFDLEFAQVYATDVLVFVKPGAMTGNVPMRDMLYWRKTSPDNAFKMFGRCKHCGKAKRTDEARNVTAPLERECTGEKAEC
jgi:hypothetical protein